MIDVYLVPGSEEQEKVWRSLPYLSDKFSNRSYPTVAYGSPAYHAAIEHIVAGAQPEFRPMGCLTQKQAENARFFRLLPNSLYTITDANWRKNWEEWTALNTEDSRDHLSSIDTLYINRLTTPTNSISCCDAAVLYCAGHNVHEVISSSGLTGWDVGGVYSPSQKAYLQSHVLLRPLHVLPVCAQENFSSVFLAYQSDELDKALDCNVTAEVYDNAFFGDVVVSHQFASVYQEYGFKGIGFQPVLEVGSNLFQAFIHDWNQLNQDAKNYGFSLRY